MKPKVVKMKGKIDAKEFAVPAQDHRGHSTAVNFRVSPEMRRAIGIVLETAPETGWVTTSDFWRWAGRSGLQFMESKIANGELSNYLRQMELMRFQMVELERVMEFRKTLDLVTKTVQDLQANNPGEVLPALMRTRELIDDIDDSSWRRAWQTKFDEQFGHLLMKRGKK